MDSKGQRTEIFEYFFQKISKINKNRPTLVGIDGIDGSGKSIFSKALTEFLNARGLNAIHSSVDYFHNPRVIRHNPNKPIHISYFEDSFNYTVLRELLLDPLKKSTRNFCVTKHFDHKVDAQIPSKKINILSNMILVFDGIFNHRDELKEYWDLSLFLDVEFHEAYRRMASRDGCPPDPKEEINKRYYQGQKHYFELCNPKSRASVVIDNNDFQNPKITTFQKVNNREY